MRIGKQTVKFKNNVFIKETGTAVGVKEGKNPLKDEFDIIIDDDYFGEKSWEKAESKLLKEAIKKAVEKSGLKNTDIDYAFGGDLLNQCISSHYALRDLEIPFLGVYGACSTMTESMIIGAMAVAGGFAKNVLCATSSHFCAAEKQFRFPLDYGGQRPPTAQWTVTGSGCAILSDEETRVKIESVTPGKIIDMGICDLNNMGAAMAPAAVDTISVHLKDMGIDAGYYDKIYTGDLGIIGSDILCDLMNKSGIDIYSLHEDCGKMIYDFKTEDVHAGGSGCGCCASVFCGHIFRELKRGNLKRILLVATGALMNASIVQQGESIPVIAHAVGITAE